MNAIHVFTRTETHTILRQMREAVAHKYWKPAIESAARQHRQCAVQEENDMLNQHKRTHIHTHTYLQPHTHARTNDGAAFEALSTPRRVGSLCG